MTDILIFLLVAWLAWLCDLRGCRSHTCACKV